MAVKVRMASRFQRMRAVKNYKRVHAMKYVWKGPFKFSTLPLP